MLIELFWVASSSFDYKSQSLNLFFHKLTKKANFRQIPGTDQGQNQAGKQELRRKENNSKQRKSKTTFEFWDGYSFDIPNSKQKHLRENWVGWNLMTTDPPCLAGCPRVKFWHTNLE